MLIRCGWIIGLGALLAACRMVAVEPASSGHYRSVSGVYAHYPVPADTYRVVSGDTLYAIAFRHGLDFRDLARWNGIDAPFIIQPGQILRLLSGTAQSASSRRTRAASATVSTMVARVPVAGKPDRVSPVVKASSIVSIGKTRLVGGVYWHWPVSGPLLKPFRRHDASMPGIQIGGKAGTPVRAAANGLVVYSGNGLVGYGELIIIKHNDTFLSAYGHNRRRLVVEGQQVKAGQQIAQLGSTSTSRNELEFQIRKNGNPVNPLHYLPAR